MKTVAEVQPGQPEAWGLGWVPARRNPAGDFQPTDRATLRRRYGKGWKGARTKLIASHLKFEKEQEVPADE